MNYRIGAEFEKKYLDRGSIIHNLDFWTKFFCILILPSISVFISSPIALIPNLVFFICLVAVGNINIYLFWRNVRIYYILLIVTTISLSLFFIPGNMETRIVTGLILSSRFVIAIGLGVLFSMVTDPIEIPTSFIRAKLPHRYGVVMMVAYRMMPLIADRVATVINVQKARGAKFSLNLKRLPMLITSIMSLMVPIIYSTLETSVGLSDTLIARGYDPYSPTITVPQTHVRKWDIVILFFSLALIILAVWL